MDIGLIFIYALAWLALAVFMVYVTIIVPLKILNNLRRIRKSLSDIITESKKNLVKEQ